MYFTNDGGLLLGSNKRFSWTCVQMVVEEAAQLINVSQSVDTASWIEDVRHVQPKFINFSWKL
jgi:hypothetical protein